MFCFQNGYQEAVKILKDKNIDVYKILVSIILFYYMYIMSKTLRRRCVNVSYNLIFVSSVRILL